MNNNKWFEYEMDNAIVTTSTENVEDLRCCINLKEVSLTLRTQEARLVFSKVFPTLMEAKHEYWFIGDVFKGKKDNIVKLADWDLEIIWNEK